MSLLPRHGAVMAVGGIVAVAAIGWLVSRALDKLAQPGAVRDIGQSVGAGAVDLTLGVIGGVNDGLGIPRTSDMVGWANSSSNPLQPLGAWIGGTLYDLTH